MSKLNHQKVHRNTMTAAQTKEWEAKDLERVYHTLNERGPDEEYTTDHHWLLYSLACQLARRTHDAQWELRAVTHQHEALDTLSALESTHD